MFSAASSAMPSPPALREWQLASHRLAGLVRRPPRVPSERHPELSGSRLGLSKSEHPEWDPSGETAEAPVTSDEASGGSLKMSKRSGEQPETKLLQEDMCCGAVLESVSLLIS